MDHVWDVVRDWRCYHVAVHGELTFAPLPVTDHPAAVLQRLQRKSSQSAKSTAAYPATVLDRIPRVTISSDDPSVFCTSLTDELLLAARSHDGMGMGEVGVHACLLNAIDAAFLPEGERTALRSRFETAWAAWETANLEAAA